MVPTGDAGGVSIARRSNVPHAFFASFSESARQRVSEEESRLTLKKCLQHWQFTHHLFFTIDEELQ